MVSVSLRRLRRLLNERAKLLEAHYADAIPLDLMKIEQERIARDLDAIEQQVSAMQIKNLTAEAILKKAYAFIGNLHQAYLTADAPLRRLMNQALFACLLIDDQEGITGDLADPFDLLIKASRSAPTDREGSSHGPEGPPGGPQGLNKEDLVPPGGLEPPLAV
jgi:site-specific DNA recombinase